MREPDVARGVLRRAVVAVAGCDGDDGRLGTHKIEKAEWRGVDLSIRTHGGDESDGAGRDQADKQGISAVGKFMFKVQFHWKRMPEVFAASILTELKRDLLNGFS